jgi:hypothetical protein
MFRKTPRITYVSSTINLQSTSLPLSSSAANSTKLISDKTRRFAIFSSSIHSKLRSYIFYTPITAAAWQRIGYEVIVVFAGDFTNNSNASLSPQLNLSRRFLQRLGVHTVNFQCEISYSIKMSQIIRIFGGFLPDTIINDTDYIITTDSDIIPIREQDYLLKQNTDGFIYNAFCCGTYQRRQKSYQMYPMSHICLSKKLWRDLFIQSIQRNEIFNTNLSSLKTILLSDKASFSFDTVSLYTRQEFGQLYDSNMTKGDSAWYMDQTYSSMLLNDYCEKYPNIKIDKRYKQSTRLDSNLPSYMWDQSRLKQFGDAHVVHDEIFLPFRWILFRNLLLFLFNSSLTSDFDLYHKQFILSMRDKPIEQ